VPSTAQGRVAELLVEVGSNVDAGQVVAKIEQPELSSEIESLKGRLGELRAREGNLQSFVQRGEVISVDLTQVRRKQFEEKARLLDRQIATLDERTRVETQLLEQGLITRQTLLNTQIEQEQIRQDLQASKAQLQQLSLQSLESKKQSDLELANVRLQISDLERQLAALSEKLKLQAVVRSPYAGRILEIKSGRAGALVGLGASLFTLEREMEKTGPLEAVIFVSAFDGPAVKVGMSVQISPGNVKPEEHGYIVGKVRWVSSYPASDQGIMQLLQNEKLVQALGGEGPPIKIIADLSVDPSTPSGYKWSSRSGPDMQVRSGTLATASITTESRRPIALVIPAARKFLGV
jgi:HlyD family secretion protein